MGRAQKRNTNKMSAQNKEKEIKRREGRTAAATKRAQTKQKKRQDKEMEGIRFGRRLLVCLFKIMRSPLTFRDQRCAVECFHRVHKTVLPEQQQTNGLRFKRTVITVYFSVRSAKRKIQRDLHFVSVRRTHEATHHSTVAKSSHCDGRIVVARPVVSCFLDSQGVYVDIKIFDKRSNLPWLTWFDRRISFSDCVGSNPVAYLTRCKRQVRVLIEGEI